MDGTFEGRVTVKFAGINRSTAPIVRIRVPCVVAVMGVKTA